MVSVAEDPRATKGSGAAAHALEQVLPGWPPGTRWGLAKHVAAVLDCDVNTVYRMRAVGRLPARPHGERAWRFDREVVLAFVQGRPFLSEAAAGVRGRPGTAALEADAPPLAQALALLGSLTPDEQEVLSLEAARRAQEGRQSTAGASGLAVVRGGRR